MRTFLVTSIFITLGFITPAMAEPITKEMANKYYQNCNTQASPQGLSKQSQELLCACTASKMMEHTTTEDIQAMNSGDETARPALNKMIIKVYAPCMEYPAKDHYYNTCINNPQTKTVSKNPKNLCDCMSDKVSKYLGTNGEEIFAGILNRNPNIVDPMTALESDPDFQAYTSQQIMGCI